MDAEAETEAIVAALMAIGKVDPGRQLDVLARINRIAISDDNHPWQRKLRELCGVDRMGAKPRKA